MNLFIRSSSFRRTASLAVIAVVAAESLLSVSAHAQQGGPPQGQGQGQGGQGLDRGHRLHSVAGVVWPSRNARAERATRAVAGFSLNAVATRSREPVNARSHARRLDPNAPSREGRRMAPPNPNDPLRRISPLPSGPALVRATALAVAALAAAGCTEDDPEPTPDAATADAASADASAADAASVDAASADATQREDMPHLPPMPPPRDDAAVVDAVVETDAAPPEDTGPIPPMPPPREDAAPPEDMGPIPPMPPPPEDAAFPVDMEPIPPMPPPPPPMPAPPEPR
jgi:hypothetical protein